MKESNDLAWLDRVCKEQRAQMPDWYWELGEAAAEAEEQGLCQESADTDEPVKLGFIEDLSWSIGKT